MAGTSEDDIEAVLHGFLSGDTPRDFAKNLAKSDYTVATLLQMSENELVGIIDDKFPEASKGVKARFKAAIRCQQQKQKPAQGREQEERHAQEKEMLRLKVELSALEGLGFRRSGFTSAYALAAANERVLEGVLPGRPGLVLSILKAFGEPPEQPSKKPKIAPHVIQLFAQSAAESYRKWERDYQLALSKVGEDPEEMHRPFLELKIDPLGNFPLGFLLWVRECYTDMKDILSAAQGRRFTILGTSGIGMSLFTVFWICYRATLKEKVVWKQGEKLYLLDFSAEPSAKKYDSSSLDHPDIQEVLEDENAWLVIDGRQAHNLVCACKIVQACSMRKENYKEYAKNQQVELQYFPVWEEEEIHQFLDEFEQHRSNYKHMVVPLRDDALHSFQQIGGVARYVLCGSKTESHLKDVKSAVGKLSGNTWMEYVAGTFKEGDESDAIVHMKCQQSEDEKYSDYTYDFASFEVRCKFIEHFELALKVDVVQFMTVYANSIESGNRYGYAFELVAHALLVQGGQFPMKRVKQGKDPKGEEVGPLKVPTSVKVVFFQSLDTFPPFEADTYYRPRAEKIQSIDAILHPDYLLQYFSYSRGVHGYMVKGLEEVGVALGLSKCKVCSCVPIDKYDETGFQPWRSTKKRLYKAALPKMIKDSEQYVIGLDYKNFSS